MNTKHTSIPAALFCIGVMTLSTAAIAQDAVPANAPVTYSHTVMSKAFAQMAVSQYRDGSREMIELTRAADAAHPKGWISRMWFDFNAHLQYAVDSNAPGKCSLIKYSSDGPPGLLDPVGGAADTAAEIPADAKPSGTETLDGVQTNVYQPGPNAALWVDPVHHLAIKERVTLEGSTTPQTLLDLSGIRFDKPDPALLQPP
ncbi:MAG: hypothetical protein ACRETW_09070, partial [Stenotrophobium sp.]